jgi:hypothetical protein
VIAPLALDAHRAVRRMIARGSHRVGHTHKRGVGSRTQRNRFAHGVSLQALKLKCPCRLLCRGVFYVKNIWVLINIVFAGCFLGKQVNPQAYSSRKSHRRYYRRFMSIQDVPDSYLGLVVFVRCICRGNISALFN